MTEPNLPAVTVYGRNSEGDSSDFPGATIALRLGNVPAIRTVVRPLSLAQSREELNNTLQQATFAQFPASAWPIIVIEFNGLNLLLGNTVQTQRELIKYLEHTLGKARVVRIYGTAEQITTGALSQLAPLHPELLQNTLPATEEERSAPLRELFGERIIRILPFEAFPIFVVEYTTHRFLIFGSDDRAEQDLTDLTRQLIETEEARAAQRRAEEEAARLREELTQLREETSRAISAITEAANAQVTEATRRLEERFSPQQPTQDESFYPAKTYTGTFAAEAAELLTHDWLTYDSETRDTHRTFKQLPNYSWHYQENIAKANHAFTAALKAAREEASDTARTAVAIITDLYGRDRALWAASIINKAQNTGVMPLRLAEIPGSNSVLSGIRRQIITNWPAPEAPTAAMTQLLAEVPPDELVFVTYDSPDPILYAQYGLWYVKITEWE